METGLGHTLSTAHRAAELISALARFGFGEFVLQTGLDKHFRMRARKDEERVATDTPLPVRVRLLLQNLGPTFVKAGQIASTRPDLIPPEWTVELRKLQSEVPAAPWEGEDGARAVLEHELGDIAATFASIDEVAFAAASMAQVHRATLPSGDPVVVKILRRNIREEMAADIELMRLLGRLTRAYFENLGFNPEAVIDEFSRQLERETDLTIEANSTMRMRRDFADQPGVTFPYVHQDLSTRSVLVMEEIKGTLLTNLDVESLTQEQRERIVQRGADAIFRQCLVIGFFHADPHPGNIFVLPGEDVCFIDCGMTGLIDPETIGQLAQIVHGAVSGDLMRVIRVALRLTRAEPAMFDNRSFRADVWQFVDRFHAGTFDSIQMGALLNDFFAILRKYRLRCPADIVYLIKAVTTIEGVAASIAPWFDLVTYVRPYVERLIRQRYSPGAIKDRLQETFIAYGDLIEELPRELGELMRTLRRNQLSLQLEHRGIDEMEETIDRASVNVSWALIIAALMVGASVLVLADNLDRDASLLTTIASTVFILSLVIGVVRLVHLRWWTQRRRRRNRTR